MQIEYDDSFFTLKPCINLWNHFKTTYFPHMQEKIKSLNHTKLLESKVNCCVSKNKTSQNLDSIDYTTTTSTNSNLIENLESSQNSLFKIDRQTYTEILQAWQDLRQTKNYLHAESKQDSSIEINSYIKFLANYVMQTIQLDSIKRDLKLQENIYKYIESLCKQNIYIELIFVDNEAMQELNKQYMAKDYPTDVLSFPLEIQDIESKNTPLQCLGSIIINIYEVCNKATLYKHNLYAEVSLLFIHAFLHLLGFDHECDNGEQRAIEQAIIESLFLPNSLIVRVDSKKA